MNLKRNCVICGKRLLIKVDKKKKYAGGHYFGKMKVPIGKGKYIKVGNSNILGKRTKIVRWDGKEEEFEYWECDKCFSAE